MNEHKIALQETGFWGRAAAGAIVVARKTGRVLIAHRAEGTLQAGTWGTWGGAVDGDETPEQTVRRELSEEAGYSGECEATALYVFEHASGFRYSNFLITVEHEFEPTLNWETQAFGWFAYGDWPDPLHFGLKTLFNDDASLQRIAKVAQTYSNTSDY